MKINRNIVESYLGQKVEVKIFTGETFVGELHKTREEKYKNNPNLYIPKNYYLVEFPFYNQFGILEHSTLFRSSHIRKISKVIY